MKRKLKHTYALLDSTKNVVATYKLKTDADVRSLKRSRGQLKKGHGELKLVKLFYKNVDKI